MEWFKDDFAEMNKGSERKTLTLLQLNEIVSELVSVPETTAVWVTAEISDFSNRRHAYLELVQKDDNANTVAKARATIWANTFYLLDNKFRAATGQHLAAGQKVMFLVSATFHPAYGFSLNITDVNPEFTLGDRLIKRKQAIERLSAEGIINMNRELEWSLTPMRLAVISSESAAGYGDFFEQLHSNSAGLRFETALYPAIVQGSSAAASIIDALEAIAADIDCFDGVVLIRGGGATDDLSCFEDYDLAANIAQFPLPVIIGIGHERDITLLDYVANMRVKTPTAAAAWLVERATDALNRVLDLGDQIRKRVAELMVENRMFLSHAELILKNSSKRIIENEKNRLQLFATKIESAASGILIREKARISADEMLLKALSPEATLMRGYTITLLEGKANFNPVELKPGDRITTLFSGNKKITSEIK